MKPVVRAFAVLCVAGALAACKTAGSLNDVANDLSAQIDRLLGTSSLSGKYLKEIAECNEEQDGWKFRPGVEDAFERTRTAIRGLATCDYTAWADASLVVQHLSLIAEQHPSALVRAESMDTLAVVGGWTIRALPAAEPLASQDEVYACLKVLRDSGTLPQDDPASAAQVASAITTLSKFRFDAAKAPPPDADRRDVARVMRSQLNSCRGVLKALNGDTIDAFGVDPRVRSALDAAWVSCSASTVRAVLLAGAVADPSEIARTAAVRDLATIRPEIGAAVLAVALRSDLVSSVRREAARSLGNYDGAQAVPALIPALDDDMPEVRASALLSLETLTGQTLGENRVAWTRWWQAKSGSAPASAPAESSAQ